MEEEAPENEKNKKSDVKLVTIPTGETLAFETPEGKVLGQEQLLVYIANKIVKIEKAVA